MRITIGENQDLQFERVISRYYRVSPENFSQTFEDFIQILFSKGYSSDGPFFYSINSGLLEDGTVTLQLFLPVSEENQNNLPEDFIYSSYFQVLNMIAIRVLGDSEVAISKGLKKLSTYLKRRRYKEKTPTFYVVTVDGETIYTDIMIGLY